MNKWIARPIAFLKRGTYFDDYFKRCAETNIPAGLHVGCGDRPIADWCNGDIFRMGPVVQYLNAVKPLPFKEGSFQYVFSEHFIEHLPRESGLVFFREAYRVLKSGGTLRTATPDLRLVGRLYDDPEARAYVDWIVDRHAPGQPKHPVSAANLLFYGWGHCFIYDPTYLQEILTQIGFKRFRIFKPGQSEIPYLKNLEQHGKSVPPAINDLETFVLEADK